MDSKVTILTVNGAGHFVPLDRAGPALQMLYNFVQNTGNYSQSANVNVNPGQITSTVAPASTTAFTSTLQFSVVSLVIGVIVSGAMHIQY